MPHQAPGELKILLLLSGGRPHGCHRPLIRGHRLIVEVLHQQLVMDMDWAVDNARGGIDERKSLDFGAFCRIAPSYREKNSSYYKYFDDELLANHAEFTYEFELPKTFGMEETPYCTVIVMTKTGHRAAIKTLKQMISGGAGM